MSKTTKERIEKEKIVKIIMRYTDARGVVLIDKLADALLQAGLVFKDEVGIDEEKVNALIRLRYFKLMCPDITERDAEIVADTLSEKISFHSKTLLTFEKG